MSWVLIIGSVWVLLAILAAPVIGRVIRRAEEREIAAGAAYQAARDGPPVTPVPPDAAPVPDLVAPAIPLQAHRHVGSRGS